MPIYLINPAAKKRKGPVAKRLPPRNKDGTFRKRRKAATTKRKRRRNPGMMVAKKAAAPKRRAAAPAAPARRRPNPRRPRLRLPTVKSVTDGAMGAAQTLVGKVGVRIASGYLPMLPKVGAAGLAAETAVALAIGILADMVLGKDPGRFVLAGALAAPLETAIVAAEIPFLSEALSPGASSQALGRYAGYGVYAKPALAAYPDLTPRPGPVAHGTSYVGYDECANALC
jgi:hypothetical protein